MTVIPTHDILDLLRSLVDKSLVVYEEQNGLGRYCWDAIDCWKPPSSTPPNG